MRIFNPYPFITAFYDGRNDAPPFVDGHNWVHEGALSVGISSYAVLIGNEALIFDTHVSVPHAELIRSELEAQGAERFTVILSHWHLDHVAGTAAFPGCEVISSRRTAEHLAAKRDAIEAGTLEGPPPINPLILPTRTYDERMSLRVGPLEVELIEVNIHSDDATVLWLPQHRILLAGDTMEDTATFVGEPQHFDTHLSDLDRLWALDPKRILPSHGDPDIIANGGYEKTFIRATQQYIRALKRCVTEPELRTKPLKEVIAGPLDMGWVTHFPGYDEIHELNVGVVLKHAGK